MKIRPLLIYTSIVVVGIGGIVLQQVAVSPSVETDVETTPSQVHVQEVAQLTNQEAPLTVTGTVVAADRITVVGEAQGRITSFSVSEGDRVARGQVLARLANSDKQAAVAQARANLKAAQAELAALENNTGTGEMGSTYATIKQQHDTLVSNAYRSLLNTDIRAYPEEDTSTQADAPTISGTYTGTETGTYILDLYASKSDSGASFQLSGLERALGAVDTKTPVPLGARGLYIQFPESFSTGVTWEIPIPNTRSSKYTAAKNAYDAAVEAREVALNQNKTSIESLAAQEARIEQLQAALDGARIALEKTIIRAPFSGVVTETTKEAGDTIAPNEAVATISNLSELHIETYVTKRDASNLYTGMPVYRDSDEIGVIAAIAPTVESGKVKVTIRTATTLDLTAGETIPITFMRTGDDTGERDTQRIPLTALKVTPEGLIVFTVNEAGELVSHEITEGPIVGEYIEVRSGIDADMEIVTDARGLHAGDHVQVQN